MSFNPPQFPAADATYQYGNITWRFDGTAGVWNIVDASLVGAQGPVGPQGPKGDKGETGAKGDTGQPATGDSAAIIVSNGFITARLGAVGSTGVLGVNDRFAVVGGIIHHLPASNGASGIASFDSSDFNVSATGHVTLNGELGGGPTGDTVVAGVATSVVRNGNEVRINNMGVTSFGIVTAEPAQGNQGTTGAVTIGLNDFLVNQADDQGQVIAYLPEDPDPGFHPVFVSTLLPTATYTVKGIASFSASNFVVNNGAVSLSGAFGTIGVTGIRVNGDAGATGAVNLINGDNITITRIGKDITIAGEAPGSAINALPQQVLFAAEGAKSLIEGTGSSNFLFDGASATFAGSSFNLANTTTVRGGVFFDAAESGSFTNFGSGPIAINATGGNVQRIRVSQSSSNYTVSAGGGWANSLGVAESVVVIMQSENGRTGTFDSSTILTPTQIVLGGVTGGIDVFTMMCVGNGSGTTLKMAFQIAKGMTGTNFSVGTS